ncbi:MAG: hypothetical protein E6G06_15095 [Actinobacteria bacterium]|nr:MAG: hypothetical protein E6G06_15095 [Actinomycetota bacterium]
MIAGAACSFVAAFETSRDHFQPTIDAEFSSTRGFLTLEGRVTDSGLRHSEHVRIRVFRTGPGKPLGDAIYQADQGADAGGKVDAKFSVPLEPNGEPEVQIEAWTGHEPDCAKDLTNAKVTLGCVLLSLPAPDARPHLVAAVDGNGATQALQLKISKGRGVDDRPIEVRVDVVPTGATGSIPIFRTVLTADAEGHVSETLRVTVPADATSVCSTARLLTEPPAAPSCPPSPEDHATAWALIAGPIGDPVPAPARDP